MTKIDDYAGRFGLLLFLISAAILPGCGSHAQRDKPAAVAEASRPGSPDGYLPSAALPDALALLPPPPTAGSLAFALDEEYSKKSLALRGTPAWKLAILDADLNFPHAASAYSCALDAPVTQQDTPHLYTLLQRTLSDASQSTKTAKQHYQRPRPFLVNKQPMCTPDDRERLEKSGAYPSGHNAAGMAWALILAEISPERANAILARGQAFGASRMVCNVHWLSDAVQGRYLGAYVVARLHADPDFRADLESAKAELAAVRAKGQKPTGDCALEREGMELQRSLYQ